MSDNKKKIAFFVGNDITAQLVLNGVIKDLYENRRDHNGQPRYEPVVYLPAHPGSIKANLPELKEFAFYERGILNNVVFPFVDSNPKMGAKNFSPTLLADKYGFELKPVPNVNDPEFVNTLSNEGNFAGAFSIRCFQIFKQPIIDQFKKEGGFFLNTHPGLLPKYRGVMSTVRAMHANEGRYGWTLHEVDSGIDTGDILWVSAKSDVDTSKPAVLVNADLAPLGISCIKRAFDSLDHNEVLAGYPQEQKNKNYFTYPTRKELKAWTDGGITLVDRNGVVKKLVEEFSVAGSEHANQLAFRIHEAIDAFDENNRPETPVSSASARTVARTAAPEKKDSKPGKKAAAFTSMLGGGMPDPTPA